MATLRAMRAVGSGLLVQSISMLAAGGVDRDAAKVVFDMGWEAAEEFNAQATKDRTSEG